MKTAINNRSLFKGPGCLIFILALVNLALLIFIYKTTNDFIENTTEIQGKIVRIDQINLYYLIIFFDTPKGTQDSLKVQTDVPEDYAVGDNIPIRNDINNPERYQKGEFWDIWNRVILVGIPASILILISIIIIIVHINYKRKLQDTQMSAGFINNESTKLANTYYVWLGVFCLVIALVFVVKNILFLNETISTTGKIINVEKFMFKPKGKSYKESVYYYTCEFISVNNDTIKFKTEPSHATSIYDLGESVPVNYYQKHPEKAKVMSFSEAWILPLCLGIIGIAFIAINIYRAKRKKAT
jgi:heme/copper-type cytochrome/quinol oxidase subunit 2